MALPIEDYALIGDRHTAALVGRNGSIDWLCLPRFDSSACFASILGTDDHGHWQLVPDGEYECTRRYLGASGVLETTFTTETGVPAATDRPTSSARSPGSPASSACTTSGWSASTTERSGRGCVVRRSVAKR
jgi:hypothetical protein